MGRRGGSARSAKPQAQLDVFGEGHRQVAVADNADHSPAYLARVRDIGNGYLSVPFAEDVELSLRLG